MTADPFAQLFRSSAELFVQSVDLAGDRLLVQRMAEVDYAQASFLDQRILTEGRARQWFGWDEVEQLTGPLPCTAQAIFHIGHVGSTLLSRLLGEVPGVLGVREPVLLRTLAELRRLRDRPESPWSPERFDHRTAMALGWLSRTFRPDQRALIKATSFVSDLAPAMLAHGQRALFLTVRPDIYLPTILAGEASVQELGALSATRLQRLHGRMGEEPWRLWALSLGERAALGWACEMAALVDAEDAAAAGQLLWVDFDRFLDQPAEMLTVSAKHFGYVVENAQAETLVSGPIMSRYSKAPEHAYSPQLRHDVLAAARREQADEIARGLAWLERAARDYPLIARALERGTRGGH
ncbi:hypothetical protein SAMN06295912_101362 [Sphingomonas laterariae]|uniref:Sulfotransferase family protein n=1 Tax=Edaphosphingomonas laterariae TaxID=861865 RepID=A0A239BQU0_9SPHN|nr:hypothetical protein [Sphingomonas laterariae]SNS10425.1 hypothetical protein SAMN06295912_101362 [Sphingomonas laterariae]